MDDLSAARLLRRARIRAGLTQRELSARAGTSQSVVARIESGATDPGTATLVRLLAAAGFTARCVLLREAGGGAAARRGAVPAARLAPSRGAGPGAGRSPGPGRGPAQR